MRVMDGVFRYYVQYTIVFVRGGFEGSLSKWHIVEQVFCLVWTSVWVMSIELNENVH